MRKRSMTAEGSHNVTAEGSSLSYFKHCRMLRSRALKSFLTWALFTTVRRTEAAIMP